MTSPTPVMNAQENVEKNVKFNTKVKETWGKLTDEDIKLYSGNREQFFAKLQEKQNVTKEDAEKRLQEIEKSCAMGYNSADKSGATKVA